MRATCPKLSNRWIIMGSICDWILDKCILLRQHIEETKPKTAHRDQWWPTVVAVNALTSLINIVFVKLQTKNLLVSQQAEELVHLVAMIVRA